MEEVPHEADAPLKVTLRETFLDPEGRTIPWIDVVISERTSTIESIQAAGLDFNFRWASEPFALIRQRMHLYFEKTDSEEVVRLAAALNKGFFPFLQGLEFRHCTFGDMGMELLLTAISGIQHHLHTLVMWGSGITKQGAGKLASLMHKESYLTHLRILDLSDNNLGREGSLVLFQALEANPPLFLQKLDLYNIGMSSEAAKALARAIASGKLSTLRKMYFGLNAIGAEGCKALLSTESVVHLANLEEFFIDRNDIGDEGALAVEMAVMEGHLSSLQELHVWDSSIGTRGGQALARALKTRQIPAQTLLLEKNDIGEAGAQAFIDALVQNSRLTTEVQLDWPSETMRKQGERARFNNQRIKKILERLGDEGGDLMQGTCGKVIVCGYGQVGKTTLTNSLKLLTGVAATLKSSPGFNLAKILKIRSSAHKSSLRPSPDPGPKPTRGIEVCTIGWKGRDNRKCMLNLWDLAGQSEFHVLHSTFLSYAGHGEGDPTTFVIVCKAEYVSQSEDLRTSENELRYWLRFISSRDLSGRKRRVILVLNRFDGAPCLHEYYWNELIKKLKETFKDTIHITQLKLFIEDCRYSQNLINLKQLLIEQTAGELEKMKIPVICNSVNKVLRAWLSDPEYESFPVLRWSTFMGMLINPQDVGSTSWALAMDDALETISSDVLKAAIEYLHEVGDIIYFPNDRLRRLELPGLDDVSLIVVAPQWLCQKIVGQILVPKEWLKPEEKAFKLRQNMKPDGSISVTDVNAYLNDQLQAMSNQEKVLDLMAILMSLGICYKVGKEKLLFPVLVKSTYAEVGCWEGVKVVGQCVMGRALKLVDSETSALPMHFFSTLQVELKQSLAKGNDSEYSAAKSHVSFKKSGMAVLLEFCTDEMDARNDRIDILVKPSTASPLIVNEEDSKAWRKKQLLLVDDLWERVVRLSQRLLGPAIQFSKRIVKPFDAVEPTPLMRWRNIEMTVDEVKLNVIEHGPSESSNWVFHSCSRSLQYIFTYADLLSYNEMLEVDAHFKEVIRHARGLCSEGFKKGSIKDLPSDRKDAKREESNLTMPDRSPNDDLHEHPRPGYENKLLLQSNGAHQKLDELLELVKDLGNKVETSIARTRTDVNHVLRWMQAQARFLDQEKERSVPRYMYVIQKPDSIISTKKIFLLHLMCEQEQGKFHHVQDQQGVPISGLKNWARGGLACLKWSLTVIGIAVLVGGLVVPGLSLAIPAAATSLSAASSVGQVLTTTIDRLLTQVNNSFDGKDDHKVAQHARNAVNESGVEAQGELKDWLWAVLGPLIQNGENFRQKFGLHRVTVLNEDESRREVLWVCEDCHRKYGRSIIHTPSFLR